MPLFSKAFWLTTLELVVVAFAAAFAASLKFTNGTPTWSNVVSAAIAGGVAAIYALARQIGSVKTFNALAATERGEHSLRK